MTVGVCVAVTHGAPAHVRLTRKLGIFAAVAVHSGAAASALSSVHAGTVGL